MTHFIHLNNRSLVFINGSDHVSFLQGLISGDVSKIAKGKAIYSLMLNPQGRFLYEFFITKYKDGLILEVANDVVDGFIKKLSFYRLRSDVEIKKLENIKVFFIDDVGFKMNDEINFKDPRKENFGIRCYSNKENFSKISQNNNLIEENLNFYHNLRLNNKIIDENDLIFDKSIIVEYGMDDFNAIDYEKGCYVGQEVVARSHYRGQRRKKIFLVEVNNLDQIVKGSEITWQSKKQGVILSSLFYQNKLQALSLIKNVDLEGNEIDLSSLELMVNDKKVIIKK